MLACDAPMAVEVRLIFFLFSAFLFSSIVTTLLFKIFKVVDFPDSGRLPVPPTYRTDQNSKLTSAPRISINTTKQPAVIAPKSRNLLESDSEDPFGQHAREFK